jgi:TolA-binding protein
MRFKTMRMRNFAFMIIAFFAMISVGCAERANEETSSVEVEDVKQETQDLMEALQGYTADQRDEAVQKTSEALDRLDQRISELETRIENNWDEMSEATREQSRASLQALRDQRVQVAEWHDSLKSSSADAWDHTKQGFSEAYGALAEAWENAQKEFSAE